MHIDLGLPDPLVDCLLLQRVLKAQQVLHAFLLQTTTCSLYTSPSACPTTIT